MYKESLQGIYKYLSVTSVASSFVVTFVVNTDTFLTFVASSFGVTSVTLIIMFFTILNKVIDKKINKRYN